MIKRSEIFAYAEKQYNAKPDCPFENYRRYAVLRHSDDDKWFGLVMNVSRGKLGLKSEGEVDVLDIKCHPAKVDDLKTRPGFRPWKRLSPAQMSRLWWTRSATWWSAGHQCSG